MKAQGPRKKLIFGAGALGLVLAGY